MSYRELDKAQRAAATSNAQVTLVKAGPGAGKTRTLIGRIAYLQEVGEGPIVAITFTRRAAEQLAVKAGKDKDGLIVTTIHGLALRILAGEKLLAGEEPPLVAGKEEQQALLDRAWSLAGGAGALPAALSLPYATDGEGEKVQKTRQIYEAELKRRQMVDFAGLVREAANVISTSEAALSRWQMGCRHILIDEFQDVDPEQLALLKLMLSEEGTLFAIGDGDQAIYSFRGATLDGFNRFETHFQGARIFSLDQSYRCPQSILTAARAVLGKEEELKAQQEGGEKPQLLLAPDGKTEAKMVLSEIEAIIGGASLEGDDAIASNREEDTMADVGFSDIAVLYRLQSFGDTMAKALEKAGIPYRRRGGRGWVDDRNVRRILAILELMVDEECDVALRTIMKIPKRGYKPAGRRKIEEAASYYELTLLAALRRCVEDGSLSASQRKKGAELLAFIDEGQKELDSLPLGEQINRVIEWLGEMPETKASQEALQQLRDQYVFYPQLTPRQQIKRLIAETQCIREGEWLDKRASAVTLSTFHSAKGLEFPVVFVTGVEEGIVPLTPQEEGSPDIDLDEERRLLYVAMTRASRRLYITRAQERKCYPNPGKRGESPFLQNVAKELFNAEGSLVVNRKAEAARRRKASREAKKNEPKQLKLFG